MNDYKYNIGDLVHVNIAVLDQLPPENRKRVPKTFKSNLFTISKRRKEPCNQYFVPGYDWQGGDCWVNETFISKWADSGPLRVSVTIDPEGATLQEREANAKNIITELHTICKKRGVSDAEMPEVDINYQS